MMTCDCPYTVLSGMMYGVIFLPEVLLLIKIYEYTYQKTKLKALCILFVSGVAMILITLCFAVGVKTLNDLCPDKLLFMSFVHGVIIPCVITSFLSILNLNSLILNSFEST